MIYSALKRRLFLKINMRCLKDRLFLTFSSGLTEIFMHSDTITSVSIQKNEPKILNVI